MTDQIFSLIEQEEQRQREMIGLIPSENHISPEVYQALGSTLSSKYSEGYPGRRYYEGSQIVDKIENEARDRLKELFGVPHANVQPYSGSPANSAIEFALLEPGDVIMGLALPSGGHLTHGHPNVTFSGKYFKSVQYGVTAEARSNFKQIRELALEHKPKLIFMGGTAYPFTLEFEEFRKIADEVGAWLAADISHITGLIIAGQHPSPVPFADVVMSTTHKTFRGPRGAMIMVTQRGLDKDSDLGGKIDRAVFPALQGGPHNATTAGIAIAAAEAMRPEFKKYGEQVVANAKKLGQVLESEGLKLVGGGTDTHLLLVDLTDVGYGLGTQVAYAMDLAGMYANKNTIPNEPCSPFYPSGLRLGTPLVTTRGMKEKEMVQIAKWIAQVVEHVKQYELPKEQQARGPFIKEFKKKIADDKKLAGIRKEVKAMAEQFPLFTW
jgi:glycine hydroxymethyltransferase